MQNKLNSSHIKPGFFLLMLVMGATRFHHFGSSFSLPDASLATFFLAGFWYRNKSFFTVLLLEAGLIDYIAITQFGVSDFCISPAYVFLIPTYAAVWLGGRYSYSVFSHGITGFAKQVSALVISITVAFIISNGSFYLLSDKYTNINWVEYSSRFVQYYPSYLNYAVFYVALILVLKMIFDNLKLINLNPKAHK